MNKIIAFLFIVFSSQLIISQIITINNNDDIVKVTKNDTAIIKVDYAFIVPPNKASLINTQLAQLVEVKNVYKDLKDNRSTIITALNKTDKQLRKLLGRLKKDDTDIDVNLNNLLSKIDVAVTNISQTNDKLKANNITLQEEVENLKKINSDLKKITRGIWWNGFLDKTVMLAAGTVLGILITSI